MSHPSHKADAASAAETKKAAEAEKAADKDAAEKVAAARKDAEAEKAAAARKDAEAADAKAHKAADKEAETKHKAAHHHSPIPFVRAGGQLVNLGHVISVGLPVEGDPKRPLSLHLANGTNLNLTGDDAAAVLDALGGHCDVG
jgi:hypothetical protein